MSDSILLLGGTGKTARRIARRLTDAGHAVRTAARSGADVRFDWDDPASHDPALAGVRAVYVVPPAMRLDYPPAIAAFLARARAAGVERAVLLGVRGGDAVPESPFAQAEAVLRKSGLAWSVVRPAWFLQNFTEAFLVPGEDGAIVAPVGDGAVPFVDAEDIAAVAAAALAENGHGGEAYDVSGPEPRTFADAAEVLARHLGRPVRHVDVPADAWHAEAVAAGLPDRYAAKLTELFDAIREGREAYVSDGVRRALGREPATLEAWATREVPAAVTA